MKRASVLLIAAILLLTSSFAAFAAAPEIQRVEYEGFGIVDVEFFHDVRFKKPEVAVSNEAGERYPVIIWDLDDDEITFSVDGLNEGKEYRFVISGVSAGLSGEYTQVEGQFVVPTGDEAVIKEIDYDSEDRELEIEFHGKVQYENLSVEIMDDKGNSYDAKIREKDRDSIELHVSGLERGGQYRAVVNGVKAEGGEAFVSVSGLFTAR